jgi:hypothetical protein
MAAPGLRMSVQLSIAKQLIWPRVRRELQRQRPAFEALDSTPMNLTTTRPVISKEKILLIEAIHDLFVERKSVEELWQAWEQPDIWRLPHSHASKSLSRGLTGRILGWLSPRLEKRSAT